MKKFFLPVCLLFLLSTAVPTVFMHRVSFDLHASSPSAVNFPDSPLAFEPNTGQFPDAVQFVARSSGYTVLLSPDEAVFAMSTEKSGSKEKPGLLRMKFDGAGQRPAAALDPLPGRVNYLIGSDPEKWHTDIPRYAKVKYSGIYAGVDLVYYGERQQLEYDLIVHPGADPGSIRLNVEGATAVAMDELGDLVLQVQSETVRLRKPVVYQDSDDGRHEIQGEYVLVAGNRVGFAIGEYDHDRPLIIDPIINYSARQGGPYDSFWATAVAVDPAGNPYITGTADFPAFSWTASFGNADSSRRSVFVSKFNPSGDLLYSTWVGSPNASRSVTLSSIAVDAAGDAYVTGVGTVPLVNAFQTTGKSFIFKLNPTGSTLIYSTAIGGSGTSAYDIAVDSAGSAYVIGQNVPPFVMPTVNAIYPNPAGGTDVFVLKVNAAGSALVYATYLGGSGADQPWAIALDSAGNAYLTGYTFSSDFPTVNPIQTNPTATMYPFVTKINAAGSAIVFSTYLPPAATYGGDIAVDSSGSVYVAGGGYRPDTGNDVFAWKLNSSGSALLYSTTFGGSNEDVVSGLALDGAGNAVMAGRTDSSNFPAVNPLQSSLSWGTRDTFISKLNAAGSGFVYSTVLGGAGNDYGGGVAADGAGRIYVTGNGGSPDFPVLNAFHTGYQNPQIFNGQSAAFLLSLSDGQTFSIPTLASISPSSVPQFSTVPLTLTGTNFVPGSTTVGIGILTAEAVDVTVVNSTTLTATLKVGGYYTGTFAVSVTTPGGHSNNAGLTITPPAQVPTLTSISPSSGAQGTVVGALIAGTNFTTGTTSVNVSGTGVSVSNVNVTSPTQMTATLTIAADAPTGSRDVTVTNPAGTSNAVTLTIVPGVPPPPTLASITPTFGARGTTTDVTLNGTAFDPSSTTVNVSGDGITAGPVNLSSSTTLTTSFTVSRNATLGARNVTVTTPNGTSNAVTFSVCRRFGTPDEARGCR